MHNTISVDLSHVLELLRPSTLRYPSFDFTPIQSKLGVLSRNYSERARERYGVGVGVGVGFRNSVWPYSEAGQPCGRACPFIEYLGGIAANATWRHCCRHIPAAGVLLSLVLRALFAGDACDGHHDLLQYRPNLPWHADAGGSRVHGALRRQLDVLDHVSQRDVRHVTPEPLSDATERARMTRDTAAFAKYCERLRASGDPLQIAQANGLAYAYLRPTIATARVSRSRFEQLMALRGKMLVSRRLQNLGFGEYAPAIVDDLRYEEPAAIEGLSADEVGLIADQVWVEPGRKKRFVESLTGLPKEGGQWKAVIGTGFQLGRLKVSLEWGDNPWSPMLYGSGFCHLSLVCWRHPRQPTLFLPPRRSGRAHGRPDRKRQGEGKREATPCPAGGENTGHHDHFFGDYSTTPFL